jgi:type VI secretion system protein ImpE
MFSTYGHLMNPPPNAQELFRTGRLTETIKTLGAELRDNPADTRRRTFLFELLCFAGEYERADRQLEVLAQAGPPAELAVLLYRSALYAQRQREDLFARGDLPKALPGEGGQVAATLGGTLNGKPFQSLTDADSRVGARLELFAAGNYLLLPLQHISSISIPPPKLLRDLLWTSAAIRTTPSFQGAELGEVLLPVLSPFSWKHKDETVRLGRMTVWEEEDGQDEAVPFGQKMWLVDGEEIPFLELRELEFDPAPLGV